MASTHQTVVRVTSRGFSQFNQRHLVEPDHYWNGLNLRQNNGRLEQTPLVGQFAQMDLLLGEAAASQQHLINMAYNASGDLKYVIVNETNARFASVTNMSGQTLIPVILQTAKPANNTLTGECLLYGFNSTDFSAQGDNIDVEIVTASTFRWRRNGGSWSSSLPIQGETAIGGNGLYVAFQAQGALTDYSNYTPGNKWTWAYASLPNTALVPSTAKFSYSSDTYGRDLYIGGVARNIMRLRNGFLTSVGYSRVYGMHVAVFFGHLFVSQFAQAGTTISDPYDAKTTPFVVGWSHLNNPDQFYNTLINEADQKALPQQQFSELSALGITGMAPWRSLLYVFLADAVWTFQYTGLPNVFQISQLNSNIGSIFRSGVVRTPQALYFIGRNDFYKISEFEPEAIGRKVRNKFFSDILAPTDALFQQTFGFYNPIAKEVVWTYYTTPDYGTTAQCRQVVYNEQTDDWYFRNMPSAQTDVGNPLCAAPLFDSVGQAVYGGVDRVAYDQKFGQSSFTYFDTLNSDLELAHTKPFFETPFFNYGDYFHIKQSDSLFIDAAYTSGLGLNVYSAVKPIIGDGNTTMVQLAQNWVPSLADQRLSLPRQAYRSVAYKFEFEPVPDSPVIGAVFNLFQEFFLGANLQVEK